MPIVLYRCLPSRYIASASSAKYGSTSILTKPSSPLIKFLSRLSAALLMSAVAKISYNFLGSFFLNSSLAASYAGELRIAFLKIAGLEVAPLIIPFLISSSKSLSIKLRSKKSHQRLKFRALSYIFHNLLQILFFNADACVLF